MRVTTQLINQRRMEQLQASQARLEEAQNRVSTGRKLDSISDNTADGVELLSVQSLLAQHEQSQSSINNSKPVMDQAELALGQVYDAIQTARKAGQLAMNTATSTPESRAALSAQVRSAAQTAMMALNSRYDNRYVFGGTRSDSPPFVNSGGSVSYAGSSSPMVLGQEGGDLALAPVGSEVAGNLFANLDALAQAISTGDTAAVNSTYAAIGGDATRVLSQRGDMGARLSYVQSVSSQLEDKVAALQNRQSALRDVDLTQAVVDMQASENAHQATLAMAGRMGNMSLLDYLR